jgi:hypothetical protein
VTQFESAEALMDGATDSRDERREKIRTLRERREECGTRKFNSKSGSLRLRSGQTAAQKAIHASVMRNANAGETPALLTRTIESEKRI